MSYDELDEQVVLPFDRTRIERGGSALADYMEEFVRELQERYLRDVNRYANHFRGWTHASDFDKLDGGDHYDGSIQTPAAALAAWTNPLSSYTQASTSINDVESVEAGPVSYTTTGKSVLIWFGGGVGYDTAIANVKLRLYRDSDLIAEMGTILTESGATKPSFEPFIESPAAGTYSYSMGALTTVGGQLATLNACTLIVMECKR